MRHASWSIEDICTVFHRECRVVWTHCPDGYAKTYARGGLGLFDREAIDTQISYLLTNMGRWRGELARETKEKLKTLQKEARRG